MKRALICGLSAALLLANLVACGNAQADQPTGPDTALSSVQIEVSSMDVAKVDSAQNTGTATELATISQAAEPIVAANITRSTVSTKYGRYAGSINANFVTDGQFFYYIENSGEFFYGGIIKQSIQDGSKSFLYQGLPWEMMMGGSQFDNLNLMDGWLYFTGKENREKEGIFSSIYRIRTDGTGLSLLYESQCSWLGEILDMLVVDDTIYFIPRLEGRTQGAEAPSLESMNLDGSNLKTLLQDIPFAAASADMKINVLGRQLLLKDSYNCDSIISYDIDSGEKSIIKIDNMPPKTSGYLQISSEGRMYISLKDKPTLYHFTLEDAYAQEFDSGYGHYTVVEDKLIYYNDEDGNIYLRALGDKNAITKITDQKVAKSFSYHNGWIRARSTDNYEDILFYAVPGTSQTTAPTTSTDNQMFSDVPAGEWYADPVAWAVEKNITNGTSTAARTFSPSQDCTHAQILTFLYRADRGKGEAVAEDMDKAISWAKEKGMINDSFDGNKPCTRADAVSYIWQAFGKPNAKISSFIDVPANVGYASAVSWAVEKGVTNGDNDDGTIFNPDKICTRAHIVTFLYRAYNN